MKQKFTLLMLILVTWIWAFEVKGQSLVIKTKNGSELVKQLGTVHTLTFSESNLLLNYFVGSSDSYSFSTISKLYFKPVATGIEANTRNEVPGKLSVYPNPVSSFLNILNAPANAYTVLIYRIDGTLVIQTQVSSDSKSVNVSNLTSGLYLLRIDGQAFKFIKK